MNRIFSASSHFVATLLAVALTLPLAAATPTTAPYDAARLARGRAIRAILLDALEQAYQHDGTWPARLSAGPATPALVYTPPAHQPNAPDDPRRTRHLASATVVLHEEFADHPDGIWVGYADGHLEFAPDPAALADCQNQLRIVQSAPTPDPDLKSPPPPAGELSLKVTDPDGSPAPGVLVGIFTTFGDAYPNEPRVIFAEGGPALTDAAGQLSLPLSRVFDAKFAKRPTAPLFVIDEPRRLAAQFDVHPSDFGPAGAPPREIRLSPACRVTGQITGVDLPNAGRDIAFQVAIAFTPGNERNYTHQCFMNGPSFDLLLPPGDYGLRDCFKNRVEGSGNTSEPSVGSGVRGVARRVSRTGP